MNPLYLSLGVVLGTWLGYRIGLWWTKRSLERIIHQTMARQGLKLDPELTALLRRPTVDGVARKILRKRGLCAYADVMLQGEAITLVCHDKALLQRAASAITEMKPELQARMVHAAASALADQAIASIDADKRKASGKPNLSVIDGGVK